MIFSFNSVRSFNPVAGDEGECYLDGEIQWVKVERATNFRVDLVNEETGRRYSLDWDTFEDAVGDV